MSLTAAAQTQLSDWMKAGELFGRVIQGDSTVTWADARAAYVTGIQQTFPAPSGVEIIESTLGGVPATVITPRGASSANKLLYLHGGGYISLSPDAYHGLAGNLACRANASVYIPDYRLAPEAPFPASIDDSYDAYKALVASVGTSGKVGIVGDSAGGAMVVTTMVKARNGGVPMPAAAVAISPWANLTHRSPSMYDRDGLDPICSRATLKHMARLFLGQALPDDPDASPVFADVRGLPPTLVQIGENEVMLSDAMDLARHMAEQRVRVTLEVWPSMVHVWHRFAGTQPEADEALQSAADFLNRYLR